MPKNNSILVNFKQLLIDMIWAVIKHFNFKSSESWFELMIWWNEVGDDWEMKQSWHLFERFKNCISWTDGSIEQKFSM